MNEITEVIEENTDLVPYNQKNDDHGALSKQEIADLEYTRGIFIELIEDSREAIQLMKEITEESGHPRSAEVLATTIRTASDIAEKLVELHKSTRDLKQKAKTASSNNVSSFTGGTTTNNNVFVGSTKDLQKMLQGK